MTGHENNMNMLFLIANTTQSIKLTVDMFDFDNKEELITELENIQKLTMESYFFIKDFECEDDYDACHEGTHIRGYIYHNLLEIMKAIGENCKLSETNFIA